MEHLGARAKVDDGPGVSHRVYVESGWQLIDLESDGRLYGPIPVRDHRLAVSIVALSEDPVRPGSGPPGR
jgi:hypothetical protein